MGSFNVACSISNISINCGTKIAFIPLLPSEMNETIGNKYNKFNLKPGYVFLEPSANWVSNEGGYQFYKPFSLPIFGEYNDYGGIENIEENITSKAITEYFGITIEEFVNCIGCGREDYSYCSPIFDAYFDVDKKLLSDYNTKFDEKWLIKMGFIKLENGKFKFKDQPYLVHLFKVKADEKNHKQAGFGYEILKHIPKDLSGKDNRNIIPQPDLEVTDYYSVKRNEDTYDNRERFLEHYLEITGYHLGYKEEHHDKIRLLRKLSGMFVHRDIYDMMTRNSFSEYSSKSDAGSWGEDADLNEDSLKKLGFVFRCEDKSIERFNLVYEYPGVTEYVLHSDGTWSHIAKTSEKYPNGNPKQEHLVQFGVYHPNSLIKAWKELTKIEIVIDESKRKESKYGASFDQIRDQYLKSINEENEDDDVKEINRKKKERAELMKSSPEAFKKEVDELRADKVRFDIFKSLIGMSMEDEDSAFEFDESVAVEVELTDKQIGDYLIKRLEERFVGFRRSPLDEPEGHIWLPLKPQYDKYNMLITLYEPNVVDGSLRQDIIDYCSFYWNVFSMNKLMMPASNGYQFGCHAATLALAKKTMELMQEQMKDYDEDEDNEEE
ncbi:MAG: hypothetical protein AABY15_06410 [Nanoarchaeota archaeon]